MGSTLTIRNLDEGVKQRLRLRAARHQRSMEAEARDLLARALDKPDAIAAPRSPAELRARLEALQGIWKDRYEGKNTEEWMKTLRVDE